MRQFKVKPTKSGSLSERIVILAALSNGNESLNTSLLTLKAFSDINKIEYPYMNRNIEVEVKDNVLTVLDGGEVACIIEEVEVSTLDMPIFKPDILEQNKIEKPY